MIQDEFDGHRWHEDEIHGVEQRVGDLDAVGCEQTLRGSCPRGGVRFELSGRPQEEEG